MRSFTPSGNFTKTPAAIKFPRIVQYTESKLVVLLTGESADRKSFCGVVLLSNREDYPVGKYSENWWKAKFSSYDKTVCLCNE